MKNFNYLSIILIALFSFVAVSCTTTQGFSDENEPYKNARQVGNRLYVDDPYYGTIILERDPFTGRYYDVTYGSRSFNSPYYNNLRDYRYDRYNSNRSYNSRYYDRNYNQRGSIQTPQPSEEQKRQWQEQREEARKRVLGNPKG